MQGRRRYPPEPTEDFPYPIPEDCQPGDYWFDPTTRVWYVECPNGCFGSLANHQVVEHADGTITVSPSILVRVVNNLQTQWHGYLEHGVWREV